MRIVAVIPARGGSKSIPKKNVKLLNGHPLIAYSIASALSSKLVSRVIVSTDDEEIAQVALKYGAEVPFKRPSHLAQDHVTDFPVFHHALHWLEVEDNYIPDIIIQVRPTSPFRPPDLVDNAIQPLLENKSADSVRVVTPSGQNPYKMWRIHEQSLIPLLTIDLPEPYNQPRQKLPATYWQTGHLEVIRRETITELKSLTGNVILPYIIEPEFAVDLDNLFQWSYAEYLMQSKQINTIVPQSR